MYLILNGAIFRKGVGMKISIAEDESKMVTFEATDKDGKDQAFLKYLIESFSDLKDVIDITIKPDTLNTLIIKNEEKIAILELISAALKDSPLDYETKKRIETQCILGLDIKVSNFKSELIHFQDELEEVQGKLKELEKGIVIGEKDKELEEKIVDAKREIIGIEHVVGVVQGFLLGAKQQAYKDALEAIRSQAGPDVSQPGTPDPVTPSDSGTPEPDPATPGSNSP